MSGSPPNAQELLRGLVGRTIETLTGKPNTILRIEGEDVIVATDRSPKGKPVPMAWVQDALDRLYREGELEISVPSVGYRSAFIGGVLSTLPGARATVNPRRVILEQGRSDHEE